ncbi:Elf1-domain-containing protein [Hesseltinella vesiculosa]|uniref:Transcription elongation factor 1 homolog n=1 Tax=Hesseltinella vesiculosa TaxID=101127 RepID=A0A1X2GH44_9FUNG|nr:Elf1-domain-containing protein [Hesseltinella vesiculosa]
MGKRKTKRKPVKKLKTTLDVQFNCLFCNHEKSIECRLDQSNKVGHLSCKVCDISWQCSITCKLIFIDFFLFAGSRLTLFIFMLDLDEPVDVYSAWIDACEEVNKTKKQSRPSNRDDDQEPTSAPANYDDDDDDDDY